MAPKRGAGTSAATGSTPRPFRRDDVALGHALQLVVDDFRDPTGTIQANLEYVLAGSVSWQSTLEALTDARAALEQMQQGLEHLGWLALALQGHACFLTGSGDVVSATRSAVLGLQGCDVEFETALPRARCYGAGAAAEVVRLLLGVR